MSYFDQLEFMENRCLTTGKHNSKFLTKVDFLKTYLVFHFLYNKKTIKGELLRKLKELYGIRMTHYVLNTTLCLFFPIYINMRTRRPIAKDHSYCELTLTDRGIKFFEEWRRYNKEHNIVMIENEDKMSEEIKAIGGE